jgi:putative sigma-54 modulation protein
MQIEYTGRQLIVTKSLRAIGDDGIGRIGKILGRITAAHIVLTAEKYRQSADVTVNTRLQSVVGVCESTNIENALREALARAETQAIRYKNRIRAKKRKPKEEKLTEVPPLARTRRAARPVAIQASAATDQTQPRTANGNGRAKPLVPVTVHSFPAKTPVVEPHIVRSIDSVALRAMSLEEAVKEAEFRDREVFVFRDNQGGLKVLHRKRDGKMELIEVP